MVQANSEWLTSPATNATSIWVSRLSIPFFSRRENDPFDCHFAFHLADQFRVVHIVYRCELGNRMASFCNDNTLRLKFVKNPEAFSFEYGGADLLFHGPHICHYTR